MNNSQYHPFTKFLHWSIVLLVIAQFLSSDFIPEGRGAMPTDLLSNAHFSFGLLILPVALILFFMRFFRPVEKLDAETAGLSGVAATVMQYILFALMVILPFTGWMAANGRGIVVSFFGMFDLPTIIAHGSQYGRLIGEAHSGLAGLTAFLATGHALMALYHHFILKDTVLKRMLPNILVR